MTDTSIYKHKLLEEKKRLTSELGTIAHPEKGDESWGAVGTITDESINADPNEVADKLEEYETNFAITDSLNNELRDVNDALARIEAGTYGVCETCDGVIEDDRLHANPAARTCKAHL